MRVIVVGSGGREHALCWAIAASPLLTRLWCAPGNPGIEEVAECVSIRATDITSLVEFATENAIDLVVPGTETALVAGLSDAMMAAGIACCGPSAAAARLEGSKSFAKEVCEAAAIPTPRWKRFNDAGKAAEFVRRRGAPIVIKADGLAAGKGVVVAQSEAEALEAIEAIMVRRAFGEAGAAVVIEECITGEELSFFALCDGTHAIPLGSARDHKRIGDGNTGANTGGMGAVSPWPAMTRQTEEAVMAGIIEPALAEIARRGTAFVGVLFAGLMHTANGMMVIEFNVRLGDPESQALLPRLRSDLLAALHAACAGELGQFGLRFSTDMTVAVVVAARGYPTAPIRGGVITGVDRAAALPNVRVFQAGTRRDDSGSLVAAEGRVLTVCGTGPSVERARHAAYAGVAAINYDGFYRRDIGGV